MIETLRESLWKQFGAGIDMLIDAVSLWPEEEWASGKRFFYIAYHSAVFLDYYLTVPSKNFVSPLPFTIMAEGNLPEEAVDDIIANSLYSKKELLEYFYASREKCRLLIAGLTAQKLLERWVEEKEWGTKDYSLFEILLYNMRHVQHHAAQLNMILRQQINNAPGWISQTAE